MKQFINMDRHGADAPRDDNPSKQKRGRFGPRLFAMR
jgi:hypothetical protein